MNKEKQIEEMAKDLCHAPNCDLKKIGKKCYEGCKAYIYAERAINKGYRKASDVAREIFEEIYKILEVDKFGEAKFDIRELYEIKKKYTEEGK